MAGDGEGVTVTSADDAAINEAVSRAVQTGYDVISENLKKGREAAERFRQGKYSIHEVPGDIMTMSLRLLQLARELSATTFDVCERLVHELSANGAAQPGQPAGPFRPTVKKTHPASHAPSRPAHPDDPGKMRVTVVFSGAARAVARTDSLSRPTRPTAPEDISVAPLAARTGGGAPIVGIGFKADLAHGGLIATIAVPAGQTPGAYSGLVYAAGQDVPLGVLTVELAK